MVRKSERLRVAVLMGGPSSEHDVSLQGGKNVVEALDRRRFDVRPVVITRAGHWKVAARAWGGSASGFDPLGDGGWRDLDKTMGEWMAQQGVHVVGFDALRYFRSKRRPEEFAADLAAIAASAAGGDSPASADRSGSAATSARPAAGANLAVGGCCGTDPRFIAALATELAKRGLR